MRLISYKKLKKEVKMKPLKTSSVLRSLVIPGMIFLGACCNEKPVAPPPPPPPPR